MSYFYFYWFKHSDFPNYQWIYRQKHKKGRNSVKNSFIKYLKNGILDNFIKKISATFQFSNLNSVDASSFLSKFSQKGDNSVKRCFFFKSWKFHVGKVLIHTFVKFHIPKSTGLSTVMFESTKEYIEKHTKTHKKRHNFAKNQNFKNLRKALLDFH